MKRADTQWKAAIAAELSTQADQRRWRTKNPFKSGPPSPASCDPVSFEHAIAQWFRTQEILAPDGTRARGPTEQRAKGLYPVVRAKHPTSGLWERPWSARRDLEIHRPPEGPFEFCEDCGCFCSVEETDSVDVGVGVQTFSLGRRCLVCEEDWSDRRTPQTYYPPWARGPFFHGFGRPSNRALENVIPRQPPPQYQFTGFFEADGSKMDLNYRNMNAETRAWYDRRMGNDRRDRLLVQDPYDLDTKPREFRTLHWYDTHYAEMAKRLTALLVA